MTGEKWDGQVLLDMLRERDCSVDELCKAFDWTFDELADVMIFLRCMDNDITCWQTDDGVYLGLVCND